ncbi:ATP-binding cassette sub- B member 10, mitochondrial [Saguinus oedipus]|uniref:ATP-binding cassette sub- B member 10, mitochondrial n=1 Tax=Saguinus oedipus TaxID=9490 RepID=A0ABQ9TMU7_SAGOE|nr:ATP-binding cassette sub- B member 10, mitochondrial [Saguinus oedipus]
MKGLGAGGRLWELLEREPKLPFNEGVILNEKSFQGALEFKNVHFTYPARPDVPIFQDFSLSIPSGSVTALVGPSGSGKSTVLSLLLRLYDPVSALHKGTISLDGHDIRQLNPVWLRSKIGTVSQEPILFSCSIAENIAYGADNPSSVTAEQVQRVAEVANAVAFIRNFPQGFNTVVGEKGVLLSGGQKQRIAIARALLKEPADRALGSVRSPVPLPTTPAQITLPRKLLVWLIVQVPFNQMDMPICPSKSQIAGLTGHPDQ